MFWVPEDGSLAEERGLCLLEGLEVPGLILLPAKWLTVVLQGEEGIFTLLPSSPLMEEQSL